MAERAEIAAEIEALAVHCRPPLMEVEQRASWVRDWCTDLAGFPIESIRVACRKWRQGTATKFPTPGQLIVFIEKEIPKQMGPKALPWRPASEDEYRGMTLQNKIYEHQVLAHEAYGKAGPMFRNETVSAGLGRAKGEHLTLDQMPDSYRRWTMIASNHTQEATLLLKQLYAAKAEEARS